MVDVELVVVGVSEVEVEVGVYEDVVGVHVVVGVQDVVGVHVVVGVDVVGSGVQDVEVVVGVQVVDVVDWLLASLYHHVP